MDPPVTVRILNPTLGRIIAAKGILRTNGEIWTGIKIGYFKWGNGNVK